MDNAAIADVLDRAANLIEPEGAWTQHQWARDTYGRRVRAVSEQATCWCLDGALIRCSVPGTAGRAYDAVAKLVPHASPLAWNDAAGRTQAEVVAKLREAARLSRNEVEKG